MTSSDTTCQLMAIYKKVVNTFNTTVQRVVGGRRQNKSARGFTMR